MKPISITEQQAEQYLSGVQVLLDLGVPGHIAQPFWVMVKGYGDDWENYSELTVDDLENENVVDAGYEDYQLWLTDAMQNRLNKEV
jgi:hypothetical protein